MKEYAHKYRDIHLPFLFQDIATSMHIHSCMLIILYIISV